MIGYLELSTLLVLLGNLATVHRPDISSVVGPLHGLSYTAAIIAAVLVADGRHRVWVLALVPGLGALLASRAAARHIPGAPRIAHKG
jgi:hypothetical protein